MPNGHVRCDYCSPPTKHGKSESLDKVCVLMGLEVLGWRSGVSFSVCVAPRVLYFRKQKKWRERGKGGGGAIGENGSKNMTRKGGEGLRKWRRGVGGSSQKRRIYITQRHSRVNPCSVMVDTSIYQS